MAPVGVVGALLACAPTEAAAHPMPGVSDFYAGMLHPVTAIEFLLPMIALSLLVGQQRRKLAIAMLVSFPVSLAVGAALGVLRLSPATVGQINLGSIAVLGLLVAAARPLPPVLGVTLSTVLGLTVGIANGAELGGQVSSYRFVPGLVLAGLMLVTNGAGCVRRWQAPWTRIGFRVAGSWIAAIGIMILSLK